MVYPNTGHLPSITYTNGEPCSFDGGVSQSNINTTSWDFQRRRSAQHLVTDPPMFMRSMMTTSNPTSYHPTQFHQADLSPTQINISSTLPLDNALLAPPGQLPQAGYDPIARQIQEQPWSAHNPRTTNTGGSRSPSRRPHMHFTTYRKSGPNNDGPDSAYFSQSQPAHSVLSNEPDCYNQDLSPSVTLQVEGMNVGSPLTGSHAMARTHSGTRSHISSRSGRSGKSSKQIQCTDPGCSFVSNCMSEHKKHRLRHEKPYKCEEPNCKRDGEGFTTSNDLERHKKSVHRIGLSAGSFKCASEHCKHPHKIWPRLDNFKQHIERMHKDEDHIELTKKSEFRPREQMHGVDNLTVAPGDTSFDVTGMDRSLSANPAIDGAPAIDIPVGEHDSARWSPWSHNGQHLIHRGSQTPSQGSEAITRRISTGTYRVEKRSPNQRKLSQGNAHRSLAIPERRAAQVRSDAAVDRHQQPGPPPVLSNAPQTKAEQQRSALSKLSQAVSTTSSPVNLEAFLLDMLHRATDSAKWDNMKRQGTQGDTETGGFTKSDALHAVQAISNLIKQSPAASSTRIQRRMAQGFVPNNRVCPVPKCGFAVARECDLRKHMKRHQRPYGCTYPKCYKRFGAKSDYKRHENSQHFQLEAWRCSQSTKAGAPCGLHFFRVVQYEAHLKNEHTDLTPKEMQRLQVKNRIGKNCQVRFWCGFCEAIIDLQQKRNAAWDERFDHIAHHFDREKRSIDDWICVEENKPKRELCKGMDKYVFEEEEDQSVDAEGEGDEDAPPHPPQDVTDVDMRWSSGFGPHPPPPESHSQAYARDNNGKRRASIDFEAAQRQQRRRSEMDSEQTVVNRYCCGCGSPCGSFDVECENCTHALCPQCNYVTEMAGGIDVELLR